jgi:hypothetical protein
VGLKNGEPGHGLIALPIRQTGKRHGLRRFPHGHVLPNAAVAALSVRGSTN